MLGNYLENLSLGDLNRKNKRKKKNEKSIPVYGVADERSYALLIFLL